MARRNTETFNISFLDVMSCGFGAIILLLMITKSSAPTPLEISETPIDGSVLELQRQLFEIRGETNILNREQLFENDFEEICSSDTKSKNNNHRDCFPNSHF